MHWRADRRSRVAVLTAILFGALGMDLSSIAFGTQASPHPIRTSQPDGTQITLYLRGNEYLHWYEDSRGYTVVRRGNDPIGTAGLSALARALPAEDDAARLPYVYATRDEEGRLAPTELLVGKADPAAEDIQPRVLPTPRHLREIEVDRLPMPAAVARDVARRAAPAGDVKNLVVLMRFKGHEDRPLPSREDMDVVFNKPGGDPDLAPTGSVRDVYLENSYGAMRLDSTVLAWVDLPESEKDYANGDSGLTPRVHDAIRAALDEADKLADFSDFDRDGDGFIDAVAFIHSGYGAEWGGEAGGALEVDRIWSHRWALFAPWTSEEGVQVQDYHISTGLWERSGSEPTHIGVICHETGHFFGLPDLYDYSNQGAGAGSWCMMANSWGFDGTQLQPPHFSAWCKSELGWIVPRVLTAPGTYDAAQVETEPTVFRIDSGYPNGEYLLIENRQPVGLDSSIPNGPGGRGGLAIWHIDEMKPENDDPGHPTQVGWPANNKHYKVALLQADGRYDLESNPRNRGDGEDLYRGGHVNRIDPDTLPSTDSYQGGIVAETGHRISEISNTGPTMSFQFGDSSDGGGTATGGLGSRVASNQFSWEARKSASSDTNLLEVSFTLDRPMDVVIEANTSVSSGNAGRLDFSTGFHNREPTEQIWTESLRWVTTEEGGGWVNFGSSYTTRLSPGAHTIYWKIWVAGGNLSFDSGSMSVHIYDASPVSNSTSRRRPLGPMATPRPGTQTPSYEISEDGTRRSVSSVRQHLTGGHQPLR